jgi:two-component system chemotaxis response regulator CheY
MNMLVVMDASEERRMLRNALTTLGIEALEVTGADAAIEALEAGEDYAAVLLGWSVSGRDGLELLERMRADARWRSMPVLLVTGAEDLAHVQRTIEAGVSEYLLPPHDSDSLLEKLLMLGVDPDHRKAA